MKRIALTFLVFFLTGCALITDEYQKDQRKVIAYLLEDLPLPEDSEILKVPTVPVLLRLPKANSAITSGIDHKNKKINQGIRKLPPPLAPTILGNLQIFPVPIAAPIVAKIKPKRPLNSSD